MADPVTAAKAAKAGATVAKTGAVHLLLSALIDIVKQGRKDRVEGKDPSSQFDEAMGKLHADPNTFNAWEQIDRVMVGLTSAERKNFRTKLGRVGGPDCEGTMKTLQALASALTPLTTLQDRRKYLENHDYLTPPQAIGVMKQAGDQVASAASAVGGEAQAQFDAVIGAVNNSKFAQDFEQRMKDNKQKSADRLAAYMASRRR